MTKRVIGVVALFLLLAPVILLTLLFLVFDKTDYKTFIEESFFDSTGLVVKIQGDIGLGYTEKIQLVAENITIQSPDQVDIVHAAQLGITFNLTNLLEGHWQIDEIQLSQIDLKLVRNEQGHFSFNTEQDNKTQQAQSTGLTVLPFKKLVLKDSQLAYTDDSTQFGFKLDNLNVVLEESKQFTTAQVNFDYAINSGQKGRLDSSAELHLDKGLQINNLTNKILLAHGDIYYDLTIDGSIFVDPDFSKLQAKALKLSSDSFKLQSEIEFNYSSDKAMVHLDIQAFNTIPVIQWLSSQPVNIKSQDLLKITNSDVTLVYENQTASVDIAALQLGDSRLVGEFSYQPDAIYSKIKIDQLKLDDYLGLQSLMPRDNQSSESMGFKLDQSLHINRLTIEDAVIEPFINRTVIDADNISSEGQFQAINLKPRDYLKTFSGLGANIVQKLEAINNLEGGLKYKIDTNKIMFKEVELTINETDIQGDFEYQLDKPAIYSNLTIGSLDLDNYQFLFNDAQTSPESPDRSVSNPMSAVIDQLKSMDGQGRIQIKQLKYQGVQYQGVDIQFNDA